MTASGERAPLLASAKTVIDEPETKDSVLRIYICVFIISLSIAYTWVPMIYVFRLMTCDEFYKHNEPFRGPGDRCSVSTIEASTARAVSLLGMKTTVFGVINLFMTNAIMKRFEVKTALVLQTMWPAARLVCQIIAVTLGAKEGMLMIQITQFICMFGGPAGYLLAINTYATEMVTKTERTAVLGVLQGCVIGRSDRRSLRDSTLIRDRMCADVRIDILHTRFLPYIAPAADVASDDKLSKTSRSLTGFLAPSKLFAPQLYGLPDGKISKQYGVLFLGLGVFFGVLATGFIPILIQMYATNAFHFGTTQNGYLMSFNSLIRGFFLIFVFPRIIAWGRKRCAPSKTHPPASPETNENFHIPHDPENFEAIPALQSEQEPILAVHAEEESVAFDLVFLKWSLVADGILTGCAAFSRQGWHIYVFSFLIPLASGSSSAAKGVMMEMCPPSQRADALSAMTLVEMTASLSTMSVFGILFSVFAEMGKPHLVFFCNAAVAVLAVIILVFSRFPPYGSKRISAEDAESTSQ